MKHKIVFFDMDGTLYQTENDVIQESALDAIQTLKDILSVRQLAVP